MTMPGFAPHGARSLQSRCLFSWRASDGTLVPLTGQAAAIVRASTLSGQTDAHGTSFGVGYGAPGFTALDLDSDGIREALALRQVAATPSAISWPLPVRPTIALTCYAKWVDRRPGTETGRFVFHLVWGSPVAEFAIGHTGTQQYVALFYDGTTSRLSTSGSTGGAGTVVEASATLATNGVVTLSTSINGGAVAIASPAASLTRPASTSAILYVGDTGDTPTADVLALKLAAGTLTLAEIRDML